MAEAHLITAAALLERLQRDFLNSGIDICAGFSVKKYNELVKFKVESFGCNDALGVIVGSTKVFWPFFISWLESLPAIPKDPIDNFYRSTVEKVVSQLDIPGLKFDVRYDWDRPSTGRFVHVQTAGHLAGVAHYDQESFWSCHAEYGLWFVYRASITFNIQIDGVSPTPAEPVLTKDIIADIKSWYDVAVEEKWQNFATRLKIRDACPIGKEKYRYEGDMLDYFFPISQPAVAVLERIKQKLAQKKRADEAETKSL